MSTPDFFRSRLDAMIDLQHPLAVLARRLPWDRIEQALAPKFAHRDRADRRLIVDDLLGQHQVEFGGGVSNAGRPRLSIRLMASLLTTPTSRRWPTPCATSTTPSSTPASHCSWTHPTSAWAGT
jgi:hypothetical protein